jgi:hypothetical protein
VKTILYPKKVSLSGEKPERWRCTVYIEVNAGGQNRRQCITNMLDRLGVAYGDEDLHQVSLDDGKSYMTISEAKKINAAS